MDLTIQMCYPFPEVISVQKFRTGPYEASALEAVAALFYEALSGDEVFRRAFPDSGAGKAHCRDFTEEYARTGEIHTLWEGPALLSAALWSPPGAKVPSPTWAFEVPEPAWKLYLLASRGGGAGKALLTFAGKRFAGERLLTLCGGERQAAWFRRRGWRDLTETEFGTALELTLSPPSVIL